MIILTSAWCGISISGEWGSSPSHKCSGKSFTYYRSIWKLCANTQISGPNSSKTYGALYHSILLCIACVFDMKKMFPPTFNLILQRLTSNAEIVHPRVVQPAVAAAAAQWLSASVSRAVPAQWLLVATLNAREWSRRYVPQSKEYP